MAKLLSIASDAQAGAVSSQIYFPYGRADYLGDKLLKGRALGEDAIQPYPSE